MALSRTSTSGFSMIWGGLVVVLLVSTLGASGTLKLQPLLGPRPSLKLCLKQAYGWLCPTFGALPSCCSYRIWLLV